MNTVTVTTRAFVAYVKNGVVNLAKCASTGRFMKRATVQAIIDNIKTLQNIKNGMSQSGAVAEVVEQMNITMKKENGVRIPPAFLIEAILGYPSVFDKRYFW
jgi:hypothetical protein